MKQASVDELRSMVGRSEPCMSVYAQLSGNRGRDTEMLQRLLDQASEKARWAFPMVSTCFEPFAAERVLDSMPSDRPWKGVAVFKSLLEERFHPLEFMTDSIVVVSDSFHLRPLFQKIQMDMGYVAICLERERVQVFRGNTEGVTLVRQVFAARGSTGRARDDLSNGPLSSASEARFTNAARRIAQMRLDRSTIRFYRDIDKDLRRTFLRDSVPVVLVGDDRLISLYKGVNRHRSAVIGTISALSGQLPSLNEMNSRALSMLDEIHRRQALYGVIEYRYTRPKGRATDSLPRIAEAAAAGQVKSLLIRSGTRIWGRVFRKSGRVEVDTIGTGALADDVLDDIGELVLKHKGQVFVLNSNEMPTAEPVAAVLVPRAAV